MASHYTVCKILPSFWFVLTFLLKHFIYARALRKNSKLSMFISQLLIMLSISSENWKCVLASFYF